MKFLLNNSAVQRFVDEYASKFVNIFFWLFVASFVLDRVINYFVHFPLFVGCALLLFPFLFFITQRQNPDKRVLSILVFSFLSLTILNSIVFLFDVKNISDLVFIILFFTFYFYYRNHIYQLKVNNIYLLFLLSFALFSFTFFSVNTLSIKPATYTEVAGWEKQSDTKPLSSPDVKPEKQIQKKSSVKTVMREERGRIKWKSNPQDRAEEKREYHNGLFRVPHIASYFFGFLFLFFAFQYQKTKRTLNLLLLIIALFLCLYTGSRAILLAFILSVLLFLMRRKYLIYLLLLVFGLFLLVMTNDFFITLTKNTFLTQYFVFIETSVENFTRLSRFRLWYSWWLAIQEFDFWNFAIGKSYINSLITNDNNLGYYIWFHNDFLSIFYSYGVVGFLFYIGFLIKIYRDNSLIIRQNLFIFVFYVSMIFTAVLNGFYYYFPVFLLYVFFLMIKNEKQLAA